MPVVENYEKIMVFNLTFTTFMPYIINRRLPRVERVGQPIRLPVFCAVAHETAGRLCTVTPSSAGCGSRVAKCSGQAQDVPTGAAESLPIPGGVFRWTRRRDS